MIFKVLMIILAIYSIACGLMELFLMSCYKTHMTEKKWEEDSLWEVFFVKMVMFFYMPIVAIMNWKSFRQEWRILRMHKALDKWDYTGDRTDIIPGMKNKFVERC